MEDECAVITVCSCYVSIADECNQINKTKTLPRVLHFSIDRNRVLHGRMLLPLQKLRECHVYRLILGN